MSWKIWFTGTNIVLSSCVRRILYILTDPSLHLTCCKPIIRVMRLIFDETADDLIITLAIIQLLHSELRIQQFIQVTKGFST